MFALALLAVALGAEPPCNLMPEGPPGAVFIDQGVFAAGRLWLRMDSGRLVSVAPADTHLAPVKTPNPVLAVCAVGGTLKVLTCEGDGGWSLQRRDEDGWSTEWSMRSEGDAFLAMDCGGETTAVATDRRLVTASVKWGQRASPLRPQLERGVAAVLHVDGYQAYLGLNLGEWGGGLRRIDRRDGSVRLLEQNVTGALCGGPLNTQCDPVTALTPVPWKPGCMLAAVGLVHAFPKGRLVEVCPQGLETFASVIQRFPLEEGSERLLETTVAFFGLVRVGDVVWAVGHEGLYVASDKGLVRQELPEFQEIDGVELSFAVPGLALVGSDVNRRMSAGGRVVLVFPR